MIKPLYVSALAVSLLFSGAAFGQTCKSSINESAPDSRYADNSDETVSDNNTKLMWKQCAEGLSGPGCAIGSAVTYTWREALLRAQVENSGSGFAGYTDWRLPNRKELRSLVEVQCYLPSINITVFPNTPTSWFWSSSPNAQYPYEAWDVAFEYGQDDYDSKSNVHYVRLVRDDQ